MTSRPVYAVLERELLKWYGSAARRPMVRPLIWLLVIGGGFTAMVGRRRYKAFSCPASSA